MPRPGRSGALHRLGRGRADCPSVGGALPRLGRGRADCPRGGGALPRLGRAGRIARVGAGLCTGRGGAGPFAGWSRAGLESRGVSYGRAAQLVDEQYLAEDRWGALQAALGELDAVPAEERDADWHHLRGFCYYEMEEPEAAGAEFRLALELKADHAWADLYLGHVHFDQEEYELALAHFLRADWVSAWRAVKNKELILCCRLYSETRLPAIGALEELTALYGQDPPEAPVPLELVRCLDHLTWQGRLRGESLIGWFEHLLELLEVSGNLRRSSLAPALSRLRETVRQVGWNGPQKSLRRGAG